MIDWYNDITSKNINETYKSLGIKPIRLLTFQCSKVVDILLSTKTYSGISHKSREKRNYQLDIDQLDKVYPIWCFTPIILHKEFNLAFVREDFTNGKLLDRFRCEMFINWIILRTMLHDGFIQKYMLFLFLKIMH